MSQLMAFVRSLHLRKLLTVLIVGVALVLTMTACNTGNLQGARPDNPPVQAGGANNPYKGGGDGYTNYRMSPDPAMNSAGQKS